jgi:pimeloyl-ACP methyl ester carboxylesterase
LQGYFIPAGGARPDVTLIYFHGRSNDVGTSWPRLEYLYPIGCNILAVDVRGYGLSTGSPDEAGIDIDVKAIWDFAVGASSNPMPVPTPVAASHVIVYGRSLGAAFAIQLASVQSGSGDLMPPAVLITESAFTSVAALIQDGVYVDLPPGFVARSRWDNLAKIGNVHADYYALHGTADSYVMPRYSEELVAAHAAGMPTLSSYMPVAGADHDDVPERSPLATYVGEVAAKVAEIPAPSPPVAAPLQ